MNLWLKTALCIGLALALTGCKEEASEATARPVLSQVVQVAPAPAPRFAGVVEARYARPLAFRASGQMVAREVKVGQRVKAGDRIAAIDATTLDQALRSAEAELRAAEAGLDRAKAEAARQARLVAQGAAAQSLLDSARQAEAAAKASVTSAQAALGKAREARGYAELKAPGAGVISATPVQVGQTVSVGETIAVLSQPDPRDAVVDVPEALARTLKTGMGFDVALQIAPATVAHGTLRVIAPQVDPATGTRRLKISLQDPPAGFILGTTVDAWPAQTGAARIAIPQSAIFEKGGKAQVWVIADGKTSARAVTLAQGPTAKGLRVVTAGLKGGERIAIAGVHELAEGQTVRAITESQS